MRDTCTIERPAANGKGTLNRVTMTVELPEGATIYNGKCSIGSRAGVADSTNETAGDSSESKWMVKLPVVLETVPRKGDMVRIGSNHPSLAAVVFEVERALVSTDAMFTQLNVSMVAPASPSRGAAAT